MQWTNLLNCMVFKFALYNLMPFMFIMIIVFDFGNYALQFVNLCLLLNVGISALVTEHSGSFAHGTS